MRFGDRGQTTVLMVLVLAAGVGAITLVVRLGTVAVDRAQARTAADAAALAGAAEHAEQPAALAAQRNGGQLEVFRVVDGQIEVTVRVRQARATARAVAELRRPSG